MNFKFMKKALSVFCIVQALSAGFFSFPMTVSASDMLEQAELRKSLPIQSNEIENWPNGPEIGAEAAILMEANTGTILYAKNINEKLYPASTTKILTCLIAAEQTSLNDVITMSADAVFSVPIDGSKIYLDVGDQITMDQALQAILIASANDAANGVAEFIGGSLDGFADIMNEKAAELGCTDSHFVNSNGLHDENHYTTAYDLATIGRAFFNNELLCKYASTKRLHIEPTDTQPKDIIENSKNKLYEGREYEYEYLVGSKTGYTDLSRQTLVSCAEKNGMKLICVILKEESPYQYEDTISLFDYGFGNFQIVNIAESDSEYVIDNANFFNTNNDIFGSSKPILSLNKDDYIILPNTADLKDVESSISYDVTEENQIASIHYLSIIQI
ncbi:MAG: D-alanyl-D-alanine carboxypeptidase [Lachnospiraceae bacterium]|nr:D-alanyl-D-alanine carboxypeptidase [Lachnospiraceae bacterium]